VLDLYGPLLAKALFPAYEAARGRPTVPLLRYLERTERWSTERLLELQIGLLRRLVRHVHRHTAHYRGVLDGLGMAAEDLHTLDDLRRLPILDRETVTATLESRTSTAPPHPVITKSTSGTTGQPVVVKYNAESRHWRDATRWRGYGWAGYRIGMRALHYWGFGPAKDSWVQRQKVALDRFLKRDFYVDCTPRGDDALAAAVSELVSLQPQVMIAYSSGAAALARYVLEHRKKTWKPFPVIVGAERLWPADREVIEAAFGPTFESYGCREVMLIGSECEAHEGMHTSMETMIVELLVTEPDGAQRPAEPGEIGEIAITDLHNLACPMIRYITGDLAVAHGGSPCPCGRGMIKLGPIEGRVAETLRDGRGNAVGGLVFNILFGVLEHVAEKFQVVQKLDGSVVMKVVPNAAPALPEKAVHALHAFASKYLPQTRFSIEYVTDIPLTAAGKRKVVVVEKPAA
jgi:phenylacetate-CoA ligase